MRTQKLTFELSPLNLLKMATEGILTDIGVIYKRLFNHRPVIQNEVHYFVKEFEGKRGDSDLHSLQTSLRLANEIDAIFLQEIMTSLPHFVQIREKVEEITELCNGILEERPALSMPQEEQERLDREVEEYRTQLHQEQEAFDSHHTREVERLKEEIRSVRETRKKLRTASLGSSVTLSMSSVSQAGGSPEEGTDGKGDSTSEEEEIVHS